MKNFITFWIVLFVFIVTSNFAISQTKTEETRRTVDSATGQVTITKSEIISKSEDITQRNHILIVNPLKFFLFYNLSYFTKIDNSIVVGGGLQIPVLSGLRGFGANAEVRFHPSKKAMRGFYFAPNISYNSLTATRNPDSQSTSEPTASAFSFGGLLGWQWFPGDDFAIGLGIGVDYYWLSGDTEAGISNPFDGYKGTLPALRFDIGYAW